MKKKITIVTISFVATAAILYGLLYLLGVADLGWGNPETATSSTMYVLKRRILHYAKDSNRLPNSIDEIPFLEGFYKSNTDYWGNKIEIQIKGTTVTMISYGKDRKPDGTGANLDIVGIFDAKTSSGDWAEENAEGSRVWQKVPLR